ncbi:MAG: hypothetical protein HRT35_34830, partial [Algicola sp.]|nr:hypothetical protein [Algicola sp.]
WLPDLPRGLSLVAGQLIPLIKASMKQDNISDFATDSNLPEFTAVEYNQFNFIKVKSRTYRQLVMSSANRADIDKVFNLYQQFFYDYQLDYESFVFDIYEDGRFGLNIAIPQGTKLVVDENNFLLAQGPMFCRTCHYEIQYHARELDVKAQQKVHKNAQQFLNQVADNHWQDLNNEGDFGEYSDFRDIEAFGSHRYVLRAAYSDFEEPFKDQYELNYFTAATNRDAWFQAQGILNRFDDDFFAALDKYRGTDCTRVIGDTARRAVCNDIETMLKVLISVHLTSFSNKFYH